MAYREDYVHEAGRTSAQRRRRRAVASMAFVFVLLLAAFLGALAFNQGWVGDRSPSANPEEACVPWDNPPPPKDVTVNVYNSTSRSGIARQVASDLARQKFRISDVRNDPLRKMVTEVAEIRYGAQTEAQAKVLAERFPGARLVADQSTDGILDVALGDKFSKVANPPLPVRPTNPC